MIEEERKIESDDHILVCLSASPSNEKLIRTAARMAHGFQAKFTALYVEVPGYKNNSRTDQERLSDHMNLARSFGAMVERISGGDVAYTIADYARINGVTDIVIGDNVSSHGLFVSTPSVCERLCNYAGNVEIHIIPDHDMKSKNLITRMSLQASKGVFSIYDALKCLICIVVATMVGLQFEVHGLSSANIIMLYILSVLVCAIITEHQIYSLVSSFISVVVFNFFFTYPKFSLFAYDKDYPFTFLTMFMAAFITGSLAAKQKKNARQASKSAFRSKLLFDTSQLLSKAKNREDMVSIILGQLEKLLGRETMWFPPKDSMMLYITEKEKKETYSIYPVETVNGFYGEVGIFKEEKNLTATEISIVTSIIGEFALALENDIILQEKEAAAVLAENEKLRANLLRGISHDLRTPLTSISGNASILMNQQTAFSEETKQNIYQDIYDDSIWLMQLVENILSITRMEDGRMKLNMTAELVADVVDEALRHMKQRVGDRKIMVESEDEFILAYMDARLIVQTLVNLLDNSLKHAPEAEYIFIRIGKTEDGKYVTITVEDDGPGIDESDLAHIFEMFYSGGHRPVDSRRSMGLGLYLCRSIVLAHGGEIKVWNRKPHGTAFYFTLKNCDVNL